MKKKILALCLVVALAATAIIGGTMAYFTDTDQAENTFTVGGVDIKLIEQERQYDEEGNVTIGTFTQDKELYPIVGSAQGDKDKYGMPTAENYVDKIITVQNLKKDAYIRVYVATPKALLDPDGDNTYNPLHSNIGNRYMPNGDYAGEWNPNFGNWDWQGEEPFETTIDGVVYVVDYYTYDRALTTDEVTGSACVCGYYLDKAVNYNNVTGKYTMTKNGVTRDLDYDFSNGVTIPVYAIGVQAEGFETADEAFAASFDTKNADGSITIFNPWAN